MREKMGTFFGGVLLYSYATFMYLLMVPVAWGGLRVIDWIDGTPKSARTSLWEFTRSWFRFEWL